MTPAFAVSVFVHISVVLALLFVFSKAREQPPTTLTVTRLEPSACAMDSRSTACGSRWWQAGANEATRAGNTGTSAAVRVLEGTGAATLEIGFTIR
jgi:hypothetical protein